MQQPLFEQTSRKSQFGNIQKRLMALNEILGFTPEQIQQGLDPLDVAKIPLRLPDVFVGAPTRAAVGAAITGEDPQQAFQKQFGRDPELAPSFGFIEDVALDPTNLAALGPKALTKLAALGEIGAVGDLSKIDNLGFYSRLKELISEKMGGKATPEQIMSIARGGKAEEIVDVGLEEFVKDKPKLSRAEVLDYLEKQTPQLSETVRKAPQINENSEYLKIDRVKKLLEQSNSPEEFELLLKNDDPAYSSLMREFPQLKNSDDFAEEVTLNVYKSFLNPKRSPRYMREDLMLPGSKNYRETLIQSAENPKAKEAGLLERKKVFDKYQPRVDELQKRLDSLIDKSDNSEEAARQRLNARQMLENIRDERDYQANKAYKLYLDKEVYKSPHWDEPNVLSHIRANERVDDTGKKLFHVEEIQSDWHHKGHEKGYMGNDENALSEFKKYSKELADKYGLNPEQNLAMYGTLKKMLPEEIEKYERLQSHWLKNNPRGVPNAPFKKSWMELSLKKAIQDAVKSGADRLTWTPGKLQADRYNLGHKIDSIEHFTQDGVIHLLLDTKNGPEINMEIYKNRVIGGPKELHGQHIDEVFGKEIADKILNGGAGVSRQGILKNEDLRIGGSFHKKLYDEKIPNFLKNFGKKYGAKVGFTTINNGVKVPYFEITPELKKAVLEKGLPLYAAPIISGLRLKAIEED